MFPPIRHPGILGTIAMGSNALVEAHQVSFGIFYNYTHLTQPLFYGLVPLRMLSGGKVYMYKAMSQIDDLRMINEKSMSTVCFQCNLDPYPVQVGLQRFGAETSMLRFLSVIYYRPMLDEFLNYIQEIGNVIKTFTLQR